MTVRPADDRGVLYVVPTPIGNLADMVPRAVSVLQTVDLIAAEDTRHSGKLLQHFDIRTPMTAYHDHSGEHKVQELLAKLHEGAKIALISDAGTPLISDPGYRLVALARAAQVAVIPIPGACAAIAALSASGLPCDRFVFEGFPPAKSGQRQAFYQMLLDDTRTLIVYESPHRILASLQDLATVAPERPMVLAREISKTFETFLCGTVVEVLAQVSADSDQQRGEFVLLIHGKPALAQMGDLPGDEAQRVMRILLDESLPLKQAATLAARITGEKKNRLYDWGLTVGNRA